MPDPLRTGHFEPPSTPRSVQPGDHIGPFKLLQLLGEGGMGAVWVADQAEPVRRRVALKLLKSELPSAQMLTRFEQERQALALLDHPNIAKVFDAGFSPLSPGGRGAGGEGVALPYIVMELIKGIPITQYCDNARLTPRQRLELFVPVCQAVQHAHQKGIIHRDLKPSNILVALYDNKAVPKVIDFGVAKATGPRLTEQTVYTDVGAIVGTLEYMAPEQAELNNLDIDTRADIYALGVILYELLTGSVPFSRRQLQSAGLGEMLRIIKEVEPSKPSTKITSSDALPAIAAARQMEPRKLALLVRGELDWITMKALEKERSRRYETANGLASDIQRYLNDEPVAAGPPSAGYRLRKFVRKYKGQVIAAGLLFGSLLIGLATSLTLSFWALAERGRANAEAQRASFLADHASNEATNATKAKDEAEFEAYVANLVAADASLMANESMRVRARLDACPERLRNWEWRHLHARSDQSLFVLPGRPAAISPAGDRVVTTSSDGTAWVWDAGTGKQLAALRGHLGDVTAAAISRSADRVATVVRDGTARVWDAGTGKELFVLSGHGGFILFAEFSPAGDRVVTRSLDTVRVWDAGMGKQLAALDGHEHFFNSAEFSPAGDRVVTVSADGTARVWDAGTGKQLAALAGHGDAGTSAAFSPAGDRIVTTSYDWTARVWDAGTGKQLVALRGQGGVVHSAAFSPAGDRVVTASEDGTARVWDAGTGKELAALWGHRRPVRSAAFSPAGDRVVTASEDGTARVWDAGTGKELAALRGHRGDVRSAAFSPAGDRVVTASFDGTARVWDAGPGKEFAALRGHQFPVRSAAFSPAGDRVVTASFDGTARVWDAGTGKQLAALRGHQLPVRSAAFSPAGDRVVTASFDGTARVWDAGTGKQLAALYVHGHVFNSGAFSPAGDRVVTASEDGTARVWDAGTGKELASLRGQGGDVYSAAFSPAGDRVVTASEDGTARVWDAGTGKELASLRRQGADVYSAAFSPAGDRVVTASSDGTAQVWDVGTGKQLVALRGHGGRVTCAAFSPAGDRVVTASSDGTAQVWDVGTGKQLAPLRGQGGVVHSAAFSPAGDRVVTASEDGTARVWDAGTGKELAALRGHVRPALSAAFSPAGDRIVTASEDGTMRIWDSVPYRERYPAIAAARAAEKVMRDRLAARFRAGEDLDQIAQSLVDDRSLGEVHCRAGLALVCEERERRLAEAQKLNLEARPVVAKADSPPDAVAAALDQARRASSLTPDDANITNTLGVALYRAGKYDEAIATLTKAEEQYVKGRGPQPADWAFLAMAQFKLGKADEAKKSLARLRELMKDKRHADNAENQAFLREAEALIEGPPTAAPAGSK